MKRFVVPALLLAAVAAQAASLGSSARTIIPADVQQIISVDYRSMKSSSTAMALKERVLPENIKQFETAIKGFGLDPDKDIDQLAFISFRAKDGSLRTIGIAQGMFPDDRVAQIKKRMKLKKIAPTKHGQSELYPAASGLQMSFLDPATMLFGDLASVTIALDTRDGELPRLNPNSHIEDMMKGIETGTVWSVLDGAGTQNMMRSALGDASKLADYETLRKRLLGSRYTMDFNNGVDFNLDVYTSDNFTAAGLSSLVKAGVLFRKMTATGVEKLALDSMSVDNDSAKLKLHFKTDDKKFESLLRSDLFAAVSK